MCGYRTKNPVRDVYLQCEGLCLMYLCITTTKKTPNKVPYLSHFPFNYKFCMETLQVHSLKE